MNQYIGEIYNMELTYYDGYESFCYQNCLRILLQAMGYKHPELYINAAMTLRLQKKTEGICFAFHNDMRGLLPSFNSYIVRTYEKDDARAILEKNMAFINEKQEPIIVGVDTYYLPYASNYQKNHARHTLILCGYNLREGLVYVIDWYPTWFYRGKVKLDDFLNARSSRNEDDGTIYSGSPIENNWACINRFEACAPEKLIKEFLKTSVEKFFLPICEKEGIEAIGGMCNELKRDCNIEFNSLYQSVFIIVRRVSFFTQYLKIYNDCYGKIISQALIERFNEIKGDWEMLQFLLMKQLRSRKEANLLKIVKNMETIYQKEKEIGEEMQRILGGL